MKKRFTENDVLRFLYGEMPPGEHDSFLDALYENDELFDQFEELKSAQEGLEPIAMEPSEQSMNRVMSYASHSVNSKRPYRKSLAYSGNGSMFAFHHLISVIMVFFTCITIGIAMFVYQKASKPQNTWAMTQTSEDLINHQLDERLQFAKERLQNIMDNNRQTIVPVHHDTYRLVNTDLFAPQPQNVVFLNLK